MLEVEGLSKSYKAVQALKEVSFNISPGEIVGLLGPNGAGKTTVMKALTGYLQPDEGSITVNGLDIMSQTMEAQAHIGYLPENAPLYPELSVQGYLQMIAGLRGVPQEEELPLLADAVTATGLSDYLTRPIGQLSKGYRQRVGLAQAILHRPKLLILDEPTVGLDPTQIVEIRRLVKRLATSSTVLFSTHILPEVEALCDRVIILINGEIRLDSRLDSLSQRNAFLVTLSSPPEGTMRSLTSLNGVSTVEKLAEEDGNTIYRISGEQDVELGGPLFQLAAAEGWALHELRREERTLESIFTELAVAE